MEKTFLKLTSLTVVLLILLSVFAGCGGNQGKATEGSTASQTSQKVESTSNDQSSLPLLEYSAFVMRSGGEKLVNNSNDIVTPYIEKKFNIKVKDVVFENPSIGFKERFNQFVAANNIPDVIFQGKDFADYAVATGKFADLTDYVKDMPNYNKYFDWKYKGRFLNDGKQYQLACVEVNLNDPKYASDPYNLGLPQWALWAREDILAKLGYKFTSIDDLQKAGKKPTLEDLKIEPAIDTPEKFVELLKKIKALNLKVGDKAVIPLSTTTWSQFHMGTMFDFGHWRIDSKGEVNGWLGTPDAKEWYKVMNTMYKDGLLDKDYMSQKEDQLQEKIATGRVAVGMYIPDVSAARTNMAKVNPDAKIRYIPWPKKDPKLGFFDIYESGFERCIIKKDFKDIKRLTQYFDWFFSDEGLDLLTWGPESAGLWEKKDGKKVFKDKAIEDTFLKGEKGKKGSDYYGLYDWTSQVFPFPNKAAMTVPRLLIGNPLSYQRSYAPQLDIFTYSKSLCGSNGVDYAGGASYGDGGVNTSAVPSYFWGKFQNDKVAKILAAKTDADFEKAWKDEYDAFAKETKFDQAKADMVKWFKDNK